MADRLEIVELSGDEQIRAAFPLLSILRQRLRAEDLIARIRVQETEGYRLIGGFAGGKLVTVARVRRAHTLARGAHAFVDDLVTLPEEQGKGYATQLLAYIGAQAAANGLPNVYLDSRVSAKGFYEKLRF